MNGTPATRLLHSIRHGLCAAMLAVFPAASTAAPFDYLQQALVRIITQSTLMNLADYGYINGNCLFGVYLSEGDSHNLNMHFERNRNYVVMGAGDNDINDLDLALLDSSGGTIANDTETDATPILQFRPRDTGFKKIKITNYDSDAPGFCVIVVLTETNGGKFSMTQISEALDNVIARSSIVSLFANRFAEGTFCLFGGKLREGEDTSLYNTSLAPGDYVMVGAGSNNIGDVDTFVIRQNGVDSQSGEQICADTETDNTPICAFEADSGEYYLFKHKNYSCSSAEGFVFSVLLKK